MTLYNHCGVLIILLAVLSTATSTTVADDTTTEAVDPTSTADAATNTAADPTATADSGATDTVGDGSTATADSGATDTVGDGATTAADSGATDTAGDGSTATADSGATDTAGDGATTAADSGATGTVGDGATTTADSSATDTAGDGSTATADSGATDTAGDGATTAADSGATGTAGDGATTAADSGATDTAGDGSTATADSGATDTAGDGATTAADSGATDTAGDGSTATADSGATDTAGNGATTAADSGATGTAGGGGSDATTTADSGATNTAGGGGSDATTTADSGATDTTGGGGGSDATTTADSGATNTAGGGGSDGTTTADSGATGTAGGGGSDATTTADSGATNTAGGGGSDATTTADSAATNTAGGGGSDATTTADSGATNTAGGGGSDATTTADSGATGTAGGGGGSVATTSADSSAAITAGGGDVDPTSTGDARPSATDDGGVDPAGGTVQPTPTSDSPNPTSSAIPADDPLFPFGSDRDDTLISFWRDYPRFVWLESGIQLYCYNHRWLYVSQNGYLSFSSWVHGISPPTVWDLLTYLINPRRWRWTLVSPLWADAEDGTGDVHYQVYKKWSPKHKISDLSEEIIDLASSTIRELTGKSYYLASDVVIVTWSNMKQLGTNGRMTFQAVIITDHSTLETYTLFNYRDGNTWTPGWDNAIFTFGRETPYRWYWYWRWRDFWFYVEDFYLNLWPLSGTPAAYQMGALPGNAGKKGVLLYSLSTDDCLRYRGPEYRCKVWSVDQENNNALTVWRQDWQNWWWHFPWWNFPRLSHWLPCPCTLMQAMTDPLFIPSERFLCFVSHPFIFPTQRCCYNERWPTRVRLRFFIWEWIVWDLPLIRWWSPTSGSLNWHNPYVEPQQWLQNDIEPQQDCCADSDLCSLFYKYRPLDWCWGYWHPFISWIRGDPHIQTTDGTTYTYNGRGEFWLQKPTKDPATDYFSLQGRTDTAWDTSGTPQAATVFVAFAARARGTGRVHVGLSEDRKKMSIWANDVQEDITNWYYNTTESPIERTIDSVSFQRMTDSVYITFPSGVAMKLGVGTNQMDLMFIVSKNYSEQENRGLFGVHNDNPSDDLTTPDGTVLNANQSTLTQIHNDFGEKWRITQVDSLFWYEAGQTSDTFQDEDFEPVLELKWESEEAQKNAEDLCKGDQACMYDLFVTKDEAFATSTRNTGQKNEDLDSDLKNSVPIVDGPTEIRAIVGKEANISIRVTDPDEGDTVKVIHTDLGAAATYDKDSGLFKWTPANTEEFELKFEAVDSRNASGLLLVTVVLCHCSDHGECDYDILLGNYTTKDSFRLVSCRCKVQWTGDHCEEDADGCAAEPCLPGQNCTDIPADRQTDEGEAYDCGGCPTGYRQHGDNPNKCVDLDECLQVSDNVCDVERSTCVNAIGNYTCKCKEGYEPSDTMTCADIDECLLQLDDCQHNCTNTDGGFDCSCFDGYTLNDQKCTIMDADLATACSSSFLLPCKNSGGVCVASTNNSLGAECQCPAGLLPEAPACKDINECTTLVDPCGTIGDPKCNNTVGSYECTCMGGRLGDSKRTCEVCGPGWWGEECSKICNCASDVTCDGLTGCASCSPGWTGGDCRDDVDECDNDPGICGEHASCNNTIGSYGCLCDQGYEWSSVNRSCIEINECDPLAPGSMAAFCLNQATCVDEHLSVSCVCPPGFSGDQCETDIDDCVGGHGCLNAGTCVDQVNGYRCQCFGNYYGDRCENVLCDSGKELINGDCQECEIGYYKAGKNAAKCAKCPGQQTTSEKGTTEESKCISECDLGTFIDGSSCTPCLENTYSDQRNSATCKDCPDRKRTTGRGSTSEADCEDIGDQLHRSVFRIKLFKSWTKDYLDSSSESYLQLSTWVVKVVRAIIVVRIPSFANFIGVIGFSKGSTVVKADAFFTEPTDLAVVLNNETTGNTLPPPSSCSGDNCDALPLVPDSVIDALTIVPGDDLDCDEGSYIDFDDGKCQPCPKNTYQIANSASSSVVCLPCPNDTFTGGTGTVGDSESDVCLTGKIGSDFPLLLAVLGTLVGLILLVLVVAFIVVCLKRRRFGKTTPESEYGQRGYMSGRPSWMHWNQNPKPSGGMPRGQAEYWRPRRPSSLPPGAMMPATAPRYPQGVAQQRHAGVHRGPAPYSSPNWTAAPGGRQSNRRSRKGEYSWQQT